jgi:poly(ADP-ribose) glycohydrolase
MEEIRFSICPELIAARLFTEKLEKNEVLIISGCEQFSTYTGYANTFKFNDNFLDKTGLDEFGRRKTKIVCMDAYNFSE